MVKVSSSLLKPDLQATKWQYLWHLSMDFNERGVKMCKNKFYILWWPLFSPKQCAFSNLGSRIYCLETLFEIYLFLYLCSDRDAKVFFFFFFFFFPHFYHCRHNSSCYVKDVFIFCYVHIVKTAEAVVVRLVVSNWMHFPY